MTERLQRAIAHGVTLLAALVDADRRRLLGEVLDLGRRLPATLDQPLPAALQTLTPAESPRPLQPETIRQIVDAATAYGVGRPLGLCLRRSLLRYYFLRRAGLPLVVHFGARRRADSIGGHAWLTLQGEPFHEPPQHYQGFVLMYQFPPNESP